MGLLEVLWEQVSLRGTIALLAVAVVVSSLVTTIQEDRQIKAIGHRAAKVHSRLPWALDVIYSVVQATIHHTNLEKWTIFFASSGTDAASGGGNGSYTAEVRAVSRRCIFTANPENIKAILATQFGDFGKGDIFHREWEAFLGDSIFVTDGQMWHTSRQLLRPQFVRDRISDLHCFESHLQTLFKAMANGGALRGEDQHVDMAAVNGKVMDISDLFFRYTLDVATDFLLGKDVKSLSDPDQEFAHAFNEVQRIQNIITRCGPVFGTLVPKAHFRRCLATMNAFVYQYVEQALRLSPEELETKAKSDASYTFLHELASYTRDPKVLRDQLVAVLLAGRDTTAATLSWALYELGRHPQVVRKLRAEILDTVGPDRTPTYEDLKGMKYLQNTLNETLRLYPSVPFNVRFSLHDTTLPRGGGPDGSLPVAVPKDTPVAYSTLVMQRRADLYPVPSDSSPPADLFSPDRWATWQPRPWLYVPFNGGPRICIGQQFALTEMAYVLTRMFQRFDRVKSFMQEVDGGKPTLKAEIVLQPGDGVRVAFWEAKEG
ncbi:cytochrome P450 [Cryphonectria parasitica EP155]|uniref:Cytochrome P450 n=1 Tax=Cryphonectria parasitica (strain ATCC 38755 / EP155) TaxID=660469 RepID=A0A9P4XW37_CRYP1|nr:cytochrome P450 [Cryphonectria parasitica EP155]KAF3762369.1 cytochrome P450 [Cryphonectria parasitica EP155]